MNIYENKKILVIGGTGTIGSHLVKHLIQKNPKVIRIFSRDEYKQYVMQQQYIKQKDKFRFLIGDVRDAQRVLRAMEGIDYVFHLAAMKHVPFCEYNPFEAVQTNVIGTQNVIQAATNSGAKKILFTSTDKAISPTNTYGATKLTGERLISAANYQKGDRSTVFSSVRFGNVMGSRGSVIPLFKEQILKNKEITVTDLNMVRYMMTPDQAISLILQSNESALGGEVFVLKMPVIKLSDLAKIMIQLVTKKYNINEKIKINEIGLRPGEKRYEELMTDDEAHQAIETSNMFIIPSLFNNKYDNSAVMQKAQKEEISSKYAQTISKEILEDWIITENLI